MRKNKKKGFTIIELIVVLAIISILAGVVMTNVIQYEQEARAAWGLETVEGIQTAIEEYKIKNGLYPYQSNSEGVEDPNYPDGIDAYSCGGHTPGFVDALAPKLTPDGFISAISDYSDNTDENCYTGSLSAPFFEYQTNSADMGGSLGLSDISCGGVSMTDAAYALFVGSPFPIPSLTPLSISVGEYKYYFYCIPGPIS